MQDVFDRYDDGVQLHNSFTLSWTVTGTGFGQFYFYTNTDGKLCCSNECMSKESIKKILGMMVDSCVLDS